MKRGEKNNLKRISTDIIIFLFKVIIYDISLNSIEKVFNSCINVTNTWNFILILRINTDILTKWRNWK